MPRTAYRAAVAAAIIVCGSAAAAIAQSPYPQTAYPNDAACRRYADTAADAARNQPPPQPTGSSLVGAGLGGGGAPSPQEAAAYVQQQYNHAYAECMAQRPPPIGPTPPAAPGAIPSYSPSTNELNRQQLYGQPPAYPAYPPPPR